MITAKQLVKLNTEQEAFDVLRYARNNYIKALQAQAGYIAPRAEFEPMPVPYDKPLELCRQDTKYTRMGYHYDDPIEKWLTACGMEDYWTHVYKRTNVWNMVTGEPDLQIIDGWASHLIPYIMRAYVKRLDEQYESGKL